MKYLVVNDTSIYPPSIEIQKLSWIQKIYSYNNIDDTDILGSLETPGYLGDRVPRIG